MNILRRHRKSNKKFKFKKFILVIFSLIMTTFAWFAYTKILDSSLNIHIVAWDMEYYIEEEPQTNPIGIEIPDLYPGMDDKVIKIDIYNKGEVLAYMDFHIEKFTIIGNEYELLQEGETNTTDYYINISTPTVVTDETTGESRVTATILNDTTRIPFTIELEHSPRIAAGGQGDLTITVRWIGDNDELDSDWGYNVGKYLENATETSAMSLILSIDSYQQLDENNGETDLPTTAETMPYLPSGFRMVANTDLDTGLVIKDSSGNEYVWVEVPKTTTVYPTAGLSITDFSDAEYTKIENDLHTYTTTYRAGTAYTDTYYSDAATGLTSTEYSELKKKMLKSVYQNGGFYVGRYETGIASTYRTTSGSISQTPIVQANAYPYNYVTCSQAQSLASSMPSGGYTSSLMFGVQWDLVLKYLESKGTSQSVLITNSTSWGNYKNTTFNIENTSAKYYVNTTWAAAPYEKTAEGSSLLSTGAISTFSKQSIYDLAGNVWEWTLENSNTSEPCTIRGGNGYYDTGSAHPASSRMQYTTSTVYDTIGFRNAIY